MVGKEDAASDVPYEVFVEMFGDEAPTYWAQQQAAANRGTEQKGQSNGTSYNGDNSGTANTASQAQKDLAPYGEAGAYSLAGRPNMGEESADEEIDPMDLIEGDSLDLYLGDKPDEWAALCNSVDSAVGACMRQDLMSTIFDAGGTVLTPEEAKQYEEAMDEADVDAIIARTTAVYQNGGGMQ